MRFTLCTLIPHPSAPIPYPSEHPLHRLDSGFDFNWRVRELRRRSEFLVITEQGTRVLQHVPGQHRHDPV